MKRIFIALVCTIPWVSEATEVSDPEVDEEVVVTAPSLEETGLQAACKRDCRLHEQETTEKPLETMRCCMCMCENYLGGIKTVAELEYTLENGWIDPLPRRFSRSRGVTVQQELPDKMNLYQFCSLKAWSDLPRRQSGIKVRNILRSKCGR